VFEITRKKWLENLPDLVDQLARRWGLTVLPPFEAEPGSCSWVAPAVRKDGVAVVLKMAMPHFEGMHEAEGLRFWNGDPTIRLLETDQTLGAMLLERCKPGTSLRIEAEADQDRVIAGLLRRLWRPPPTPTVFRPLSVLAEYWSNETLADAARWTDKGLVREGLRLFEELPQTAQTQVVLATDLHAGNVLRSRRMPWLVIDPKPFVGDPAYDVTQHLLNCRSRLAADGDNTIRRLADLLSIDHERIRLWTFARAAAEPRDDWADDLTTIASALSP